MSELRVGRVVRQDARVFHVDVDGEVHACASHGRLFEERTGVKNPIAVGDLVRVRLDGDSGGIEEVLPRKNFLSRVASSHDSRAQVLFANVDRVYVIESVKKPKFSSNRADRILAACRWHDVAAALVLNKIDLDRRNERAPIRATYTAVGFTVLETSAVRGDGIEELRAELAGRMSVFYGASGVGKSTLLNALRPELALPEGKVSKHWDTGRHTTTFSQLHSLGDGAVIDTPGIRVFRLHAATRGDLRGLFPEFERFHGRCHFQNCTHDHEPDCAVFDAVDRGEISATRYQSYVEMLDEISPREDDAGAGPPEAGPEA